MSPEFANAAIIGAILLVMAAIFANAWIFRCPESLVYELHPSSTVAFLSFAAAWFCILLDYFIALAYGDPSQSLGILLIWRVIGDIAKLALFLTALAYSRGKELIVLSATIRLLALLFVLVIWEIVCLGIWVKDPTKIFASAMNFAPDIILSSVAFIAIGWVVFIRWGGVVGGIFLYVTFAYAVLQLPAGLSDSFKDYLQPDATSALKLTFSLLAGGKILLAIGFLSVIGYAALPGLDIDEPKTWPTNTVTPPGWVYHTGLWLFGILTSILTALSDEAMKKVVFG
jgi:hypothetical protein